VPTISTMVVAVHQLKVQYPHRNRFAVDGVSLHLKSGEMGVLIGPSGCGKTTLLRAIAGLEPVASGEIKIHHAVMNASGVHVAPEKRKIGMVFQDYALFPHLNVVDNIAFGLHQWPKDKQRVRVQELLTLVGLDRVGLRYPHELSGGQQQRVALARALAPQPELLLLDEPFSNLDVDLRERLALEIRAILKQAKTTALFVTHDQLEAFAIGDVIGVMSEGQLHQWDDAYNLYHRPMTRLVADFIGHGVFTPASTQIEGQQWRVKTSLGEFIEMQEPSIENNQIVGECDILLRADDIIHDDDAPVKAQIIRKSFRGSEFLYTLQLENGEIVLAHVPSHHDHKMGEWIGIRAQVDHVVTFKRINQEDPIK